MKPRSHHAPIITEATDEDFENSPLPIAESKEDAGNAQSSTQRPPANNPGSLAVFDESFAQHQQKLLHASLTQQTKTTDDSRTAYGDKYASGFGHRNFAPMPEPSAPAAELNDADWAEYQAWMHAPNFAERSKFKQHVRWNEILNLGQEKFLIDLDAQLKDDVSDDFLQRVLRGDVPGFLNGNAATPPEYKDLQRYIPPLPDAPAHLNGFNQPGFYDQIALMIATTDAQQKVSYSSLSTQDISNKSFFVVSDHNGTSTGNNFSLWGPGVKRSFTRASWNTKQMLDKVEGTDEFLLTTEYEHVANRFTIIRINNNEMGFAFDRNTNEILQLTKGRYFIQERTLAYVGKVKIQPGVAVSVAKHRLSQDPLIAEIANSLTVVQSAIGKTIFMANQYQTYILPQRVDAYVIDARRNERFISFENDNQQTLRASDGSYTKINKLRPGQFIIFQFEGNTILWRHHPQHPELNSVHLASNLFIFDNIIHKTSEKHIATADADIVNLMPGQLLAVRNEAQQVKFVKTDIPKTYVLRMPWQFLEMLSQKKELFSVGNANEGNQMTRVILQSSEWAAVVDQGGHLAFYPPRFDDKPYYFAQPEHTVIQVINCNQEGLSELHVPGIGKVTVANIPSGSLGACKIKNMHFFLNPSPLPYVFVAPDRFIEIVDASKPHYQIGDLHRIVLRPEERAMISQDGTSHIIPATNGNKDVDAENGIYVFRSLQLQVYGPEDKTKKYYRLGPYEYFNVAGGFVANGTENGKLATWGPGEHMVDNRKNSWFKGVFQTNVDPIKIKELPVAFKHGITGTVGAFVQYRIVEPYKAIDYFGSHDNIHEFILETTESEILKLCAARPPLGYTDLYFNPVKSSARSETTDPSIDINDIEASFKNHAQAVLDEHGVQLSNMYIDKWDLAEDFKEQVKINSRKLNDAHAEVELLRTKIEQSNLKNDQEVQRKKAEVDIMRYENEKIKLDWDNKRAQDTSANETKANFMVITAAAEAKVAEHKSAAAAAAEKAHGIAAAEIRERAAQASMREATAKKMAEQTKADAEKYAKVAQSIAAAEQKKVEVRTKVTVAEDEARARNSSQLVESEIVLQVAKNKLQVRESEKKCNDLETEMLQRRGEVEAEIAGAKAAAVFHGLSPEQRLQLQLAQINVENAKLNAANTAQMLQVTLQSLVSLASGQAPMYRNLQSALSMFAPALVLKNKEPQEEHVATPASAISMQ